jgi:hypothetical protein
MGNGELKLSQRQESATVLERPTPFKRRFKSLDSGMHPPNLPSDYIPKQPPPLLPTHLPNLISMAAKKYRDSAKSLRGHHSEGVKLTNQVESFTRIAQAYSTGMENKAQKPSSRGIRSLLAAAIDRDGRGGLYVPKSMKELPPLKIGEIKINKIKGR